MKKLELILHYFPDDEECMGDYASAEIYLNGEPVADLEDSYHDKSEEKYDGMLCLLKHIYGKENVTSVISHIADYDG
jgi:hypothetical protein